MFKRGLLTFTFAAALGAAGLGLSHKAMAWNDCNDGFGYATAYPYVTSYPYTTYVSYQPRVAYYPNYPVRSYPVFYGRADGRHHHHDHHHSGLSISFGF
jgi:hypothetical protein